MDFKFLLEPTDGVASAAQWCPQPMMLFTAMVVHIEEEKKMPGECGNDRFQDFTDDKGKAEAAHSVVQWTRPGFFLVNAADVHNF